MSRSIVQTQAGAVPLAMFSLHDLITLILNTTTEQEFPWSFTLPSGAMQLPGAEVEVELAGDIYAEVATANVTVYVGDIEGSPQDVLDMADGTVTANGSFVVRCRFKVVGADSLQCVATMTAPGVSITQVTDVTSLPLGDEIPITLGWGMATIGHIALRFARVRYIKNQ